MLKLVIHLRFLIAQLTGDVEYTKRKTSLMSVLDMTKKNMMVRFQ